MSLFEWDDSFSVKVEMLDNHHKTLFTILNNFYDESQKTDDYQALAKVFHKVLDYTQMHFKIEEYYMKKYEFPTFDKHKALHEDLVKRAIALYDDIKGGKPGAKETAITFLKDWLEKHIKGVDTKYSSHLNKNGMH